MSTFSSIWFKASLGVGLLLLALWGFLSNLHDAYDLGYTKATTEGSIALETLRGEYAQLELKRAKAAAVDAKYAAKRLQEEQARNDQLAADLAEQQRIHRQTTDRLTGEIARVNDLYRDALDAQPKPLPACVFTRGFVRVWNEATGAAVPAVADSERTAAQVAQSQALDQLDAGIGRADVLAHHVSYAEQCSNTAAQLDALINAVQEKH